MKGIFVTIGGLGDFPNDKLDSKTVLESADTPNLDLLATRGALGIVNPILSGEVPNSEESILSFFRNDRDETTRSVVEAIGAGIKLKEGDLVFSANFGTINSYGEITDRRVARTISFKDAKNLCKELNKIDFPYNFEIFPVDKQKAILIFRGNYCENITGNDSTYTRRSGRPIECFEKCVARDRTQLARDTADMVNEFLAAVRNYLHRSPTNYSRVKKGLLPVNYLFLKMPGTLRPKLNQYPRWVSACYTPFEKGFSITSGMKVCSIKYPKMKGFDVYSNLWDVLKKSSKNAIKVLKKNLHHDYFYVHFDELVAPSQDNKPLEKKAMLEYLDKTFFREIVKIASMNKIKVLITGTQSIPCRLKRPCSEGLPVLFYNSSLPDEKVYFNENSSKKGRLGRLRGKDLLLGLGFFR